MTSMYALGWTQHSKGSQNIRCMAMLQLILGNMGMRGGGMNALRGHSNIQGLTDLGLMSNLLPGYLTLADGEGSRLRIVHVEARLQAVTSRPDELLAELQEVLRQLPEVDVGRRRPTQRTTSPINWLPKLDVPAYDVLRAFELMHQGKMNGYVCQGFNPLQSFPNRAKIKAALAQAQVPGRHRSAEDGDGPLLGGPRRVQRGEAGGDQDRRCSSCRPPASPRTRARSSTLAAGCSGIGPAGRLQVRPSPTSGSWLSSTRG